jgi:hypothetical protein
MYMATMLIDIIQHGESRTSASFLTMAMVLMNRQTERQKNQKKKLIWQSLGLQHDNSNNVEEQKDRQRDRKTDREKKKPRSNFD